MKKIILLAIPFFLASCGGDTSGPSSSLTVSSMTSERALTIGPVLKQGERRSYQFTWNQGKLTGTSKVPALENFQIFESELRLQDISISFDIEGPAGQLYRLYQAAFGRTPDVAGFGFWKQSVENGTSIRRVASEFLESTESKNLYGERTSDNVFIERLYSNVLKRSADIEGKIFWENALRNGVSRVEVLLAFSESPENIAATKTAMMSGMPFAEPGIAYIPVANALGPVDIPVGSIAYLNGTSSTDANSDPLQYKWSTTKRPLTSQTSLLSLNSSTPSVFLDKSGSYEFTLWVADNNSQSYSPATISVTAHEIVADTGYFTCRSIDKKKAITLYSTGHVYLDRNKDGEICDSLDQSYENSPPVPSITDTGIYKCSSITSQTAMLLYLQGHKYLDRDRDGKPCESSDIDAEKVYVPPPPSTGKCWVNGYRRKNGTWVNGYYRRC